MINIEEVLDRLELEYEILAQKDGKIAYFCSNEDTNFALINYGKKEYGLYFNIMSLKDSSDYFELLKIVNNLNKNLLYGSIYIEEVNKENEALNIEYYLGIISNADELNLEDYLEYVSWFIDGARIEILKYKKESASKKLKELIISKEDIV